MCPVAAASTRRADAPYGFLRGSLAVVLATLLLAAGCGSSEPEPLKPLEPSVPADLCATVPATCVRGLIANANTPTPETRPLPARCARPDGAKNQVRAVVTWVEANDEVRRGRGPGQPVPRHRPQGVHGAGGVPREGADKACAASGTVKGADSATIAALTDREVITVRLDHEPTGKQPAIDRREADARGRPQLDGRELLSRTMSSVPAVPWHRPMSGRDPDESHRASTPLELFFDLCFVVAVAAAAATLHHDLAHDHLATALAGYAMVFFAIWWAWVNYSWFAQRLRHRRHHLPADDLRADDRRARGRGRNAAGRRAPAIRDARGRLRDHADGDGPVVAPRRARTPRRPSYGAPLRRRGHRHPGLLDPAHALLRPRHAAQGSPSSHSPLGDGRAVLGRAQRGRHAVAPAPHRRALRAVHDHRARRGDPRDHAGDLGHAGRARTRRPAAAC